MIPYGRAISQSGTLASANLYRFSSKEINLNYPDAGLYYYGYRWYDPNLQRWLNRDPSGDGASIVYAANSFDPSIEEIEGPNLYSFLANTPTGLWDAFGTAKGGKMNLACEGFTKRSS